MSVYRDVLICGGSQKAPPVGVSILGEPKSSHSSKVLLYILSFLMLTHLVAFSSICAACTSSVTGSYAIRDLEGFAHAATGAGEAAGTCWHTFSL